MANNNAGKVLTVKIPAINKNVANFDDIPTAGTKLVLKLNH